MPNNNYVSQVKLPDGTMLEIKDTVARQMATGGTHYIGKLWVDGETYTHLDDGDPRTTVEITTGTNTHEPKIASQGDIVLDGGKEFIYDGTVWELMGADGLGNFAFADTGSVTVPNPTYGNPTPNHTPTAAVVSIAESNNGNLAITGTFTQPTISGTVDVLKENG